MLLGEIDTVLDLGSGSAPYADLFAHRHYVTADLLAKATVRSDAATLPFAGDTFDLVLCTEVLEHVPNPDAALEEIRRVLKRHGSFILTTPLTWGVHDARDFHRWTEAGLRQLVARHGFTVVNLEPRGGILLCLSALLLVLPWQIFGGSTDRRPWDTFFFATTYTLLLPIAAFLAAIDPLDRRRQFTHGYAALCRLSSG